MIDLTDEQWRAGFNELIERLGQIRRFES